MEWGRNAFKTSKPTGKRPLGRHRCRWEDNIKIDSKEICVNKFNFPNEDAKPLHWSSDHIMNSILGWEGDSHSLVKTI